MEDTGKTREIGELRNKKTGKRGNRKTGKQEKTTCTSRKILQFDKNNLQFDKNNLQVCKIFCTFARFLKKD